MTHDSRTISAVFMAVVLILASGTAVSLAVTDSSTGDVGTNAAVQNATTTEDDGLVNDTMTTEEVVTTTVEDDDGATDEDGATDDDTTTDDETTTESSASVTFNEQESEGETVVVESVTMEEGGFIAIHDASVAEAPLASVLGNSVYLEAGTHENVEITLARPVQESQTLVAMPHYDTNANEVYDFVLSTGELDGPYTADGEIVVDSANVSVPQDDTTTETTTTETTTTTEEDEIDDGTTTTEDEEEVVEEPTTGEQQLVFKVEQMNVENWSFVVGDEEQPDRTEVISNVNVQDRRVEINLTEVLQEQREQVEGQTVTTMDREEAQEQLEENLSQDLETVRIIIRNVNVENVTLVITAPEGMELPEPPMTTTTEDDGVVDTTTTEETTVETITTEEDTTTETTTTETTTTETTTTTTETTTTTTEDTTTEEVTTIEDTTTEEVTTVEETTVEDEATADLDSFNVSNLDAPENVSVGDTITVSATVSNPNDVEATQDVAFRLDGTVIERQPITLEANGQETVTFEIDTTDVSAGQHVHGVYTQDFGELAVITLEEPSAGEDGETGETGDDTGETTTTEESET